MKTIFILLLVLLPFISLEKGTKKILVTGPSHANAKITPIAYAETGAVLCLTESFVNTMGAHDMMDTEFGYLIVDKNGLWEEKVIHTVYNVDGYDSLEKFKTPFYTQLDLNNKPKYLIEVMEKYSIDRMVYDYGKNFYFWTKNGIYDGKDILKKANAEQKSINNYKNVKGKGTRVSSSFAINGVLFFDNERSYDYNSDYDIYVGGYFLETEFDYPIEIYHITGICFLP